jgi:hypothetical protein
MHCKQKFDDMIFKLPYSKQDEVRVSNYVPIFQVPYEVGVQRALMAFVGNIL